MNRLFRFRLRTLFVLVAFCAILLAWWSDHTQLHEELRKSELLRQMTLPDDKERILLEVELLNSLGQLEDGLPSVAPPPREDDAESKARHVATVVETLWKPGTDLSVRRNAVIHLAFEGGDEAVSALVGVLKSDSSLRKEAIRSLGRLGRHAAGATEAVRSLLNDPDASIAAHAAWALCQIDPTLDLPARITQLAQDDDAEVRRWAAYALAFSHDPRAPSLLGEMLDDREPEVRLAAAYGVMNVAPKQEALQTLAEAAKDEPDSRVRSCMCTALRLLQLGREQRQPAEIDAEYRVAFPEIGIP